MRFFKQVLKAATTPSQTTYRPPQDMSGSSITFVSPDVVVQFDPQGWNDMLGPNAGTLKTMPTPTRREIYFDIVGEAFRQGNVTQVQAHYPDTWFPIYLVLDPDNPHDKNAVAVCVGNAQVGFVDKGDARTWAKLVKGPTVGIRAHRPGPEGLRLQRESIGNPAQVHGAVAAPVIFPLAPLHRARGAPCGDGSQRFTQASSVVVATIRNPGQHELVTSGA